VTRQVRAVQGADEDGAETVWFYVPENTGDVSKTQRKGWWLHIEEQNSDGRYYIGPFEVIQQTRSTLITDLAKCNNFPFQRMVQVDDKGKQVPKTERCINDKELTVQSLLEGVGPAEAVPGQDQGQGHMQQQPARKRAAVGKEQQRNSRPRRKA
jgi:hypothetical protein